jgi:hypothetical protein
VLENIRDNEDDGGLSGKEFNCALPDGGTYVSSLVVGGYISMGGTAVGPVLEHSTVMQGAEVDLSSE